MPLSFEKSSISVMLTSSHLFQCPVLCYQEDRVQYTRLCRVAHADTPHARPSRRSASPSIMLKEGQGLSREQELEAAERLSELRQTQEFQPLEKSRWT